MRTIRASRLPLALSCPASQLPPATALADDSPESRLGSAVHQALAVLVRDGGGSFPEAIERAAASWRCDVAEVSALAWNGAKAWERLKHLFPSPEVEAYFEGGGDFDEFAVTGHADIFATVADEARILDWKTGREDGDHEQQLRAYGWLACHGDQEIETVTAVVVRLREMTVDTYRWTRRELYDWMAGVVRDTADVERYRPGRHCGYCGRRTECVPRAEHVGTAIAELMSPQLSSVADIEPTFPGQLVQAYDALRLVEEVCDRTRQAIRTSLAARGGSATSSDGRTLTLTRQDRQEIDAGRAWPILEQRFGLHAVAEAAKLTKTAVTGLAMDAAPYGKKGSAAKEIMERLDAAGAITINTIEKLEVKRNGSSNSREIANHQQPAIGAGGTDAD